MTSPTKPSTVSLSVVMPAYNEQDAIEAAVDDVRRHVLNQIPDSELIVVNDGSRDRTGEILDQLAAADARIRPIHRPNGGHGPALLTGLKACQRAYMMLVDSDLQIPLDGFPQFWTTIQEGYDGVFGIRRTRYDPKFRLFLTRVIRIALRLLFRVAPYDANVPCKLFRRDLWTAASPNIPPDTLAPSLFLAIFAESRGYRIAYRDVMHRERATGEVSIRRWKLIRFCAKGFLQLLTFRRRLRHAG